MQLSGGNIPSRDLLLQLISIEEKVLNNMPRTTVSGYYSSSSEISAQALRVQHLVGLLTEPNGSEFQN